MAQKPVAVQFGSVELIVVGVEVDGVAVTDFELCAVEVGERPEEFSAATVIGDDAGYLTGNLEPGLFNLFARVVDDPETVVILAGVLSING